MDIKEFLKIIDESTILVEEEKEVARSTVTLMPADYRQNLGTILSEYTADDLKRRGELKVKISGIFNDFRQEVETNQVLSEDAKVAMKNFADVFESAYLRAIDDVQG